jgi:hypothetical protein
MKKSPSDLPSSLQPNQDLSNISNTKRESSKRVRNHTENRNPRKRADTTPTKGSSNDEDVVGKSGDTTFLLNQSEMKKSPLAKENTMFSS